MFFVGRATEVLSKGTFIEFSIEETLQHLFLHEGLEELVEHVKKLPINLTHKRKDIYDGEWYQSMIRKGLLGRGVFLCSDFRCSSFLSFTVFVFNYFEHFV